MADDHGREDERSGAFRVQDRRRFDSDGNEREGVAPPAPEKVVAALEQSKVEEQPKTQPPPVEMLVDESEDAEVESADDAERFEDHEAATFGALVTSLATQALMQLGEVPSPEGMNLPIDPEAAEYTINILQMLRKKTEGNLDSVETRLLDDIVHNLRVAYVKESIKSGRPL